MGRQVSKQVDRDVDSVGGLGWVGFLMEMWLRFTLDITTVDKILCYVYIWRVEWNGSDGYILSLSYTHNASGQRDANANAMQEVSIAGWLLQKA